MQPLIENADRVIVIADGVSVRVRLNIREENDGGIGAAHFVRFVIPDKAIGRTVPNYRALREIEADRFGIGAARRIKVGGFVR